jgi:hypothetical protein
LRHSVSSASRWTRSTGMEAPWQPLIDLDAAAPGSRAFDLGHAAWLWLDIGNLGCPAEQQVRHVRCPRWTGGRAGQIRSSARDPLLKSRPAAHSRDLSTSLRLSIAYAMRHSATLLAQTVEGLSLPAGCGGNIRLRVRFMMEAARPRRHLIRLLIFAVASAFACPAIAAGRGSPNTLAHYDPSLVKAMEAYGPLFSKYIPRSTTEQAAPGDFVEKIEAPDGSEVRVLVKAPAPAEPGKILNLPPIASGESANDYFDRAIKEAISGGHAAVVFPKAVYNFVAPPPASPGHWLIKGAKDLTIDGQGSTINFASPASRSSAHSGSSSRDSTSTGPTS